MNYDVQIYEKLLQLAVRFISGIEPIDPPSLCHFFSQALPKSFFEVSQFQVDNEEKIKVVKRVLEFGYDAVRRGINRFRAFIFYFPEMYTRLNNWMDLPEIDKVKSALTIIESIHSRFFFFFFFFC